MPDVITGAAGQLVRDTAVSGGSSGGSGRKSNDHQHPHRGDSGATSPMSDVELTAALIVGLCATVAAVALSPSTRGSFPASTSSTLMILFGAAFAIVCALLAYADLRGKDSSEEVAFNASATDSKGSVSSVDGAITPKAVAGLHAGANATPVKVSHSTVNSTTKASTTINQDEEEDDPLWSADWAAVKTELPPPDSQSACMEVFELHENDIPMWIARLEQRRDQAQRAGKLKLAQRLAKQIAEGKSAERMRPSNSSKQVYSKVSGRGADTEETQEAGDSDEDELWNSDWTQVVQAPHEPEVNTSPAAAKA